MTNIATWLFYMPKHGCAKSLVKTGLTELLYSSTRSNLKTYPRHNLSITFAKSVAVFLLHGQTLDVTLAQVGESVAKNILLLTF